jgi:hypothetical protein
MIGDTREPDRSEENRVMMADLLEAILRHHPACFLVVGATPWKLFPIKLNAGFLTGSIEDPHPLRDDLLTNSVTLNCGDSIFLHSISK